MTQKIEIMTVEKFEDIEAAFTVLVKAIPLNFEMNDFEIIEVKDGYILKSKINEVL
jgi:hypothetical protein